MHTSSPMCILGLQCLSKVPNVYPRSPMFFLGLHCDVIARLEDLVLSGLSLAFNPLTICTAPNLKALDLSGILLTV